MMDILLTCYSFTAFVTALTASVAANHGMYLFSNCLPSRQRLLTKSSLCVSVKSRNFVCCVSGIWVHLVQFVWTKKLSQNCSPSSRHSRAEPAPA